MGFSLFWANHLGVPLISGNPPYSAIFTCHFGEVWDLHRCPYVPSLATRVFEVEETPDEKLQAMQRLEVDRELLRGISLRTSYHVAGGIFHSCWCFMMVADSFSDGWWMLMVFSDSYQKCFVGGIASIASHLAKFFEWSQRKTWNATWRTVKALHPKHHVLYAVTTVLRLRGKSSCPLPLSH